MMIVEGDDALVADLAALPGVTNVRPERIYPLVRPVEQGEPIVVNAGDPEWGIAKIGADLVWDEGILGGGVVVANIDTGVDYTHEALTNQYRGNLGGGEFSHDYNWWDPTGICGDDAVRQRRATGPTRWARWSAATAPARSRPTSASPPAHSGSPPRAARTSAAASRPAVRRASSSWRRPTSNGENPDPAKRPDIVNNSWGGGPGDAVLPRDRRRTGGRPASFRCSRPATPARSAATGGSPGDFNETFSVGATDIDDVIADFSGRGPSVYGKVNPNVSAPGVDVTSSVPGDGYASFSGTSMAAPHVAGTLALMLSAAPELIGDFDGATGPVAQTAVDIIDMSCGGDDDGDPNNVYGEGRIDAFTAVQLVATGGTLSGTVTDADSAAGVAGASIEATLDDRTYAVSAGDDGAYSMFLPAGEYFVTASAFGYETAIASGVVIETDVTTVEDFALTALPSATVSGRVLRGRERPARRGRRSGGPRYAGGACSDRERRVVRPDAPDRGVHPRSVAGAVSHHRSGRRRSVRGRGGVDAAAGAADRRLRPRLPVDPFDWVDARTPTTVYGDDQTGRMPMPFPFPYFGTDYEQIFIGSNGYIDVRGRVPRVQQLLQRADSQQ